MCIGKNISYLEVYKLMPSLLRAYEVRRSNGFLGYSVVCGILSCLTMVSDRLLLVSRGVRSGVSKIGGL